MKHLPKYLTLFGLSLALAPSLHAENNRDAETPQTAESQLDASFDVLANTIKSARQQATESLKQRDQALAELAALRKLQEKTSRELAATKEQLSASEKAKSEWKQKAETLANHLKVGDEAREKLATLKQQMEESLGKFATIEKNLASVTEEFNKPTAVNELKKEILTLRSSNAETEKQLGQTRSRFDQQQAQSLATIKTARSENEALGKQLAEEKKSRRETEARIANLEKTHAKNTKALESARRELEATREQLAGVKEDNAGIKEAAAKLKQQETRASALEKANTQLESRVREALGKLEESEKATSRLESEIDQRDSRIKQLEGQITKRSNREKKESAENNS